MDNLSLLMSDIGVRSSIGESVKTAHVTFSITHMHVLFCPWSAVKVFDWCSAHGETGVPQADP